MFLLVAGVMLGSFTLPATGLVRACEVALLLLTASGFIYVVTWSVRVTNGRISTGSLYGRNDGVDLRRLASVTTEESRDASRAPLLVLTDQSLNRSVLKFFGLQRKGARRLRKVILSYLEETDDGVSTEVTALLSPNRR